MTAMLEVDPAAAMTVLVKHLTSTLVLPVEKFRYSDSVAPFHCTSTPFGYLLLFEP